jgi:hypothetical protein
MSKKILPVIFTISISATLFAQSSTQKVFTTDIDNFWIAYDNIKSTADSLKQIHFIQTLYIDKGTPGLKAFMMARNYSAELYVRLINKYPKFWSSIRPNTLTVNNYASEIENSISKFKLLYPELRDAKMYFTIGGLRSGGTTTGDKVLIGAEIATGDPSTDVSEFPNKWLEGVFKEQSADNVVSLNIHEYVHTQQKGEGRNLLAQAITEGSCDFITELVIGKPLQRNYITYGKQHRQELREAFKTDMFTTSFGRWLYNGSSAITVADLGYFMGYDISKSYYDVAADKKKAIKEIIELRYQDTSAVETFLEKSNYYPEALNKEQLLKSFREKQPELIKLDPFKIGDTSVDASVKQITLVFSKPMGKGYSIDITNRGKEFYPITQVIGFSDDKTKFTVAVDLKPNHEYEFFVSGRNFYSSEGYPLIKQFPVKFKTKP